MVLSDVTSGQDKEVMHLGETHKRMVYETTILKNLDIP
jgi:hypothetical protein